MRRAAPQPRDAGHGRDSAPRRGQGAYPNSGQSSAVHLGPAVGPSLDTYDSGEGPVRGWIKSFNEEQGFGFIECPALYGRFGRDVFFHISQVRGTEIGPDVVFRVVRNRQGRPQARDVVGLDSLTYLRRTGGRAELYAFNLVYANAEGSANVTMAQRQWASGSRSGFSRGRGGGKGGDSSGSRTGAGSMGAELPDEDDGTNYFRGGASSTASAEQSAITADDGCDPDDVNVDDVDQDACDDDILSDAVTQQTQPVACTTDESDGNGGSTVTGGSAPSASSAPSLASSMSVEVSVPVEVRASQDGNSSNGNSSIMKSE